MRNRALRTLSALLLGLNVGCADPEVVAPDVILIDLESVRVDHLSHAGYRRPTAARLDDFRDRAFLFSHARAPSSASAASTAALHHVPCRVASRRP